LEEGTFPIDNDGAFKKNRRTIPVPNETLRQTVSRKDLGGFYWIGENWAMAIANVLEIGREELEFPQEPLVLDMGCGVGKTARFWS
jgi:hypothetical protein